MSRNTPDTPNRRDTASPVEQEREREVEDAGQDSPGADGEKGSRSLGVHEDAKISTSTRRAPFEGRYRTTAGSA
jgi:hypothetical protein